MGLLAVIPATLAYWVYYLLLILFSLLFLIVGLLLPLGLLSKMGLNIQPNEHVDCSCNTHVNTLAIFFYSFFE